MAYQLRSIRPGRKPAGPLKEDSVADDRAGVRRPISMFDAPTWRRMGAWASICVAIALAPASAYGQADSKAEGNAAENSETGLPPNYEPPRDPPPEMLFEKHILTPDELKRINPRQFQNKYLKRLRAGDLKSDAAKGEALDGIRYRLNELTIRDNLKRLAELRTRFTGSGGDLYQAGRLMDKADKVKEFRRELLNLVIKEVEPLFENNYYVRVQAALILGELNLVEEDAAAKIPREAFAPAAVPLTKVLLDPNQPEGVKIVCVLSLVRILQIGNPNVQEKRDIALALVSELTRPPDQTTPWYQRRLAEALGYVDVALDLNRAPFVFNALTSVLNDPDRASKTRMQAAWSLGRIPLDPQVDIPKMVVDVASLGKELAQVQAAQPKNQNLRSCALLLYLAFQAKDNTDRGAKGAKGENNLGGLLNDKATVGIAKDAYQQVLPIVREIIAGKTIPPERVQDLDKWLKSHGYVDKPGANQIGKKTVPAINGQIGK